MDLRDFIVTPIVLFVVYAVAYIVRPRVTDAISKRYFIPALTVRIIGALSVGFIYQFYYNGGDTYNYHTHGSRIIWEAFCDDPRLGLKMLFADGSSELEIYQYSSRILFFRDWSSYNVIRLAAFFDLFTFSSYCSTAILFAVLSFVGMWLFFQTFYQQYPELHKGIAIAAFFIPSVFFWGSGLLKDTIALSFLGVATYLVYRIFIRKKFSLTHLLVLLFSLYVIYSIKVYVLLNFLPAIIFWIFLKNIVNVRNVVVRVMLFPVLLIVTVVVAFFAVTRASDDNPKYAIGKLAETARVTAYDIRYFTGRDAGSGYTLGELDGTFQSMLRLAPAAINVSLFRPYLWEIRNPLMALSAIESFIVLLMCLYTIFAQGTRSLRALWHADVAFCLVFAISFAFAVGVSTFNFGTLVRYKIPVMPFFILALILIHYFANRERKFAAFDEVEK